MSISLSDVANYAQIASLPLTILSLLLTWKQFGKWWKKWLWLIMIIVLGLSIIGFWNLGWLKWLLLQFTLPLWLLILLSLFGLTIFILIKIVFNFINKQHNLPDYIFYTSDIIYEIQWHWQYDGNQIDINSLTPICPNTTCLGRLDPVRASSYKVIDHIELVCDNCKFHKRFDFNFNELKWKVSKEIDRRIRTGEYKK